VCRYTRTWVHVCARAQRVVIIVNNRRAQDAVAADRALILRGFTVKLSVCYR